MEQSLRNEVNCRRTQAEFIEFGIAAREETRWPGEYFDAEAVHAELHAMLDKTNT